MSVKFAKDLIKEINNSDKIPVKNSCVTGDEFEKWLRREKTLDCEVKINGQNKN